MSDATVDLEPAAGDALSDVEALLTVNDLPAADVSDDTGAFYVACDAAGVDAAALGESDLPEDWEPSGFTLDDDPEHVRAVVAGDGDPPGLRSQTNWPATHASGTQPVGCTEPMLSRSPGHPR